MTSNRGWIRGWWWLFRQVGVRRTYRYWRLGRKQGWIKTLDEEWAFAQWFLDNHSEPRERKSGL